MTDVIICLLISRSAGNGAYYIKAMNTDQYTHVYCHMNTITECGEHGGWTLVMKIDGNKVGGQVSANV